MSETTDTGVVLVIGSEPAALSCALELVDQNLSVVHVYPEPFGLLGSSRDIGLAYPELGEPFERLDHALGSDLALEFHRWSKLGIENLVSRVPDMVERGSRLSVTRTETESKLTAKDAINRSKPPVSDELRLMSGAAASNYAPVDGADQGSFETHVVKFTPVRTLDRLIADLKQRSGKYRAIPVDSQEAWKRVRIESQAEEISIQLNDEQLASGDLLVVAAGLDTRWLTGHFSDSLVPLNAVSFRTPPLKEKMRSSVMGVTASWGYERYRFDDESRLLACGMDPTGANFGGGEASVDERTMKAFLKRAAQLFTDFDGSADQLMQWGVTYAGSCDGLPVLGPLPGESRIQVAAGFAASAWSRGWYAGTVIAKAILDQELGQAEALLNRCSARRFKVSYRSLTQPR